MDAYEATRIVFSRIQTLDPENAAKIMGLLLIQDHGEKEMIRLAFGPEALLHSVILKARKELGLLLPPPSPPSLSPSSSPFASHHHHLSRQNSSTSSRFGFAHHPPPPLNITSPSWAPPVDHLQTPSSEDLLTPVNNSSPYYNNGGGGGGDLVDEISIQDQLSFLNDPLYQEMGGGGWPHSHRRSGSVADLCLGSEAAGASGFGWKPCLYFARGYCKNGTSCRFLHGLPSDEIGSPMAKSDIGMEQHCQEQLQLLRSKSQRLSAAAAGAFPYSPTGSMTMPLSPSSSKCMSFLLQQQNDNQRVAAAAAAAAALMLGDEGHKFMGGRSRLDRADFAGMVNPGSRQIYLTFPADSTFREEDVSNYFSIYGPVQDVRIPYQQKRMFGFVTFVYPETVKLILAKGNPHFVCDARVLVKPYKEKGKVPDKYRKQQQGERGDFSGCTTPTGLDSRDPYDLQQLGARMLYNSNSNSTGQEMLLRRKLEEQQQAAELQQAIELQGRRFMGLQLLDFKARSLSSPSPPITINPSNEYNREEFSPEDKSPSPASSGGEQQVNSVNVSTAADKEESARETSPNEDSDFQESVEHNLPDSPFASPTKASAFGGDLFAVSAQADADPLGNGNHLITSTLLPPTSSLDMASFKSCLFQMPRFSSGHGAVGL